MSMSVWLLFSPYHLPATLMRIRADTGDYDCEVSGNGGFGEKAVKLTVLGKSYCGFFLYNHYYLF